jgi:phosphate/sulfate permease
VNPLVGLAIATFTKSAVDSFFKEFDKDTKSSKKRRKKRKKRRRRR